MTLLIATAIIPLASSLKTSMPTNLPPSGNLDQEQAITTEIEWLEGGVDNWQEFKPTVERLSEVEIHIGCYYGGSYPITLSIVAGLGLAPLTYATLDCSSMPQNTQGWVTVDVPDR